MRAFTAIDVPQRSEAWFQARLGRVTSSRANDMLATRKDGKEAAGRANLRIQLALERITGKPQEREFQSDAMEYGAETEPEAYAAYEALTGNLLQRTGFLSHNTMMAGASLDGHVGDFEGIVEIKCPIPATHMEYLESGKVPTDYLRQVTHSLWLTGAEWCDWMSYERTFPEHLRARIVRVKRSDVDLVAYELALSFFLSEVDRKVQAIAGLAVA